MPLRAETHLGVYEIVSPLGVGGMGEVYRARDTKLEREVAIKVLPEEFLRDRERLARFEREAKLLAGLNHPNIATLYGLESIDERQLLIMELVEGETLAERIARGPIPFDEALPLFTQIADGLGSAHDKGVVHRDLKPANVKITPDGDIKILDFGLAKALDADETADNDTSQSPTLTKGTAMGVILGTAPYMSPEQARGKAVDKRTDIWAFGCCLFEALTGTKAFDGATVTDTLAAIVKNEPEWERLPADVPAGARTLLERCFSKEPNRRKRDARDIALELGENDLGVNGARLKRRRSLSVPVALVSAIMAGLAVWSMTGTGVPDNRTTRVEIHLPDNQDLQPGGIWGSPFSISPDGRSLVYAARVGQSSQLFLRRLDEYEVRALPNTEGGLHPFFSPDGERVGFDFDGGTTTLGRLEVVSLKGGVRRLVAEHFPAGASWTGDGNIVYSTPKGIWSVPGNGGEPTELVRTAGDVMAVNFPQQLPDGAGILFTDRSGDRSRIAVFSHRTGAVQVLDALGDGAAAKYVPTGHLVYVREGTILAAPFDVSELEVTGPPIAVLDVGASVTVNGHERPFFSVSEAGHLAYLSGVASIKRSVVWVDRRGGQNPLEGVELGSYEYVELSPEGTHVAYTKHDDGHNSWVYDLERQTETRLTTNGTGWSVWAPDGRSLVFSLGEFGAWGFYRKSADGSGEPELLPSGPQMRSLSLGAWSPHGDGLVYMTSDANDASELWLLDSSGESARLFETPFHEFQPAFSPNGRFLAYVSDESGTEEVYVRSYPDLDERWLISDDGGREPRWSSDGRELFYRRERALIAVPVETEAQFSAGAPTLLFEGDFYGRPGTLGHQEYDVSRDGTKFLMVRAEPSQRIHVILNWFDELERLVPIP